MSGHGYLADSKDDTAGLFPGTLSLHFERWRFGESETTHRLRSMVFDGRIVIRATAVDRGLSPLRRLLRFVTRKL